MQRACLQELEKRGLIPDAKSVEKTARRANLLKYRDDPVGFGVEILGESYTEDIIQVMLSVRDNPVTLVRSGNSVGKTHALGALAIWWYLCHNDAQVYTCAAPPEANLEKLAWGEIGSRVENHKDIFAGERCTHLNVQRSGQEFLTGVTIPQSGTEAQRQAKFSGKHSPFLLFLVDEGDAIPPEIYMGIQSCMTGGVARMCIFFNPRAEVGPLYEMEKDRTANVIELSAFNHPNVITGMDLFPGAVDRETTVRRINEWTRPKFDEEKIDGECYTVPDFLVGTIARRQNGKDIFPPLQAGWRKIVTPAFSYMVLGQYPSQGETQLISRAWIYAARSRWDAYVTQFGENPPRGVRPILGIDVGELGNDWSVVCPRYGGFVARFKGWQGVDTLVTGRKAAGIYRELGAYQANVDGCGVGAGVWPVMEDELPGACIMRFMTSAKVTESTEFGTFGTMRDQVWWMVREWLRDDSNKRSDAMLPPDDWLIEELIVATYMMDKGKIKVMDKTTMREMLPKRRSPDRADALCNTFAPDTFFTNESIDTFKGPKPIMREF